MCEMSNDGEYSEAWSEYPRKARKEHRCDSCRGRIRRGATYTVHFSVYDSSVTSEKCCAACTTARNAFAKEDGHLLPIPSMFVETLDECILDDESTAQEKRKWTAVRRNIERRVRFIPNVLQWP